MAIPLQIRLPYGSEEEFIEEYGSNVTRGGMFVDTQALQPEGSTLALAVMLEDGTPLLRGQAMVAKTWVDEGGDRSGMTLRFVELDAQSRALVDRVVASRSGFAAAEPPPPSESEAEAEAEAPSLLQDEARALRRSRISAPESRTAQSTPEQEELILGIDFGTTNCRVAVFQDGSAQVIPVGESDAVPSMVALAPSGQLVVGEAARAQLARDPRSVVFGAKRLLGRRARSPRVREVSQRFPYAIVADDRGDAGVELAGRVHRLPELFALILAELKQAARAHLGREVSRAVLCVPAYFNDHQRSALREAGKLAGLDILRMFNEPSAVALAFGYGRALPRKRILVYDLGGGTFDATVVELTGDDLEVVANGGDNFLGGMDFDLKIAGELARQLTEAQRASLDLSPVGAQQLKDAAERAKIALSESEATDIHLTSALLGLEDPSLDLHTSLTRSALEVLTDELVERTLQLTTQVFESAGLTPQGLDEVLLVGGQSRAPLVRRRLEALVGKPVRTDVDAHAAVALGAAILGHALLRAEKGKAGVTLSEVLSEPIGIGVRGGGMRRVLERNTRLPAEKTIDVPVRAGEALGIAIYQGSAARAEENEYLGCLNARTERAGELSLRFSVGTDGTLQLSALAPGGRTVHVAMTTSDASDEVRAALLAQSPLPGEPDPGEGGLLQGLRRLFGRR